MNKYICRDIKTKEQIIYNKFKDMIKHIRKNLDNCMAIVESNRGSSVVYVPNNSSKLVAVSLTNKQRKFLVKEFDLNYSYFKKYRILSKYQRRLRFKKFKSNFESWTFEKQSKYIKFKSLQSRKMDSSLSSPIRSQEDEENLFKQQLIKSGIKIKSCY